MAYDGLTLVGWMPIAIVHALRSTLGALAAPARRRRERA